MANKNLVSFLTQLYQKYGDLPFDPKPESGQDQKQFEEDLRLSLIEGYLKIFNEEDLDNVVGIKLEEGDQVIFSMRGREFVLTGGM